MTFVLSTMRRGFHIAISLIAVLLLIRPLDCFAGRSLTREAADCCSKGNCFPKKNADDCCKNAVPEGKQFATATLKAADHSLPVLAISAHQAIDVSTPQFAVDFFATLHTPLGSPPSSRLNLPLLI